MARPSRNPPPPPVPFRVIVATWTPPGVVSTMFPSPPFTLRRSPFGAIVTPRGEFSACPADTVEPAPGLELRNIVETTPGGVQVATMTLNGTGGGGGLLQ